jgi:hypothetical protein
MTAFQPNAFQSDALQIAGGVSGTAVTADIAWTSQDDTWAIGATATVAADFALASGDDTWAIVADVSVPVTADIAWTSESDTWAIAGNSAAVSHVYGGGVIRNNPWNNRRRYDDEQEQPPRVAVQLPPAAPEKIVAKPAPAGAIRLSDVIQKTDESGMDDDLITILLMAA